MKLTEQEADLFYKLSWSLHFYINQKLNIVAAKCLEDYADLTTEDKVKVRNALYEHSHLIDDYVAENPQNFSHEHLMQVLEWKKFIKGDFLIERLLKNYAVFIAAETDETVYAVLGIQTELSEIVPKHALPTRVQAVLLPFAGKIIYDGLLNHYNVYFGSGIKKSLKETYLKAKQNQRIIESLGKQKVIHKEKPVLEKTWDTELNGLEKIARKLRSGKNKPPLYSPVFSIIKASIALGSLVISGSNNKTALWKAYGVLVRALNKFHTILDRMD
ncbi:MAG: hypothetical protein GQ583_08285 [Methyloprofundus sp.]|nr:hypothetical protein [Methyloprofundus sp.]